MAKQINSDINGKFLYGNKMANADIDGKFNYHAGWTVLVDDLSGTFYYTTLGNVPSLVPGYDSNGNPIAIIDPTSDEQKKAFGVKVWLGNDQIPVEKVGSAWVRWGLNSSITWGITLRNWEGEYTDSTNPDNNPEEIKISFGGCGEITFPRLIIKEQTGTYVLTLTGVDYLSNLLYTPVTLDTYLARTFMERIDQSTYQAHGMTLDLTESHAGRILVNYEETTSGTYSDGYYYPDPPIVDEDIPVAIEAPYWAKWIMEDLKAQLGGNWYLDMDFNDFLIYDSIPIWNRNPIEVFEDIIEAIPGEWYIKPKNNTYTLVIQEIYDNNNTAIVVQEKLLRAEPQIRRSTVRGFNTISVTKPAVREAVEFSWKDISTESTEEIIVDFYGQYAIKDTIQLIKTEEIADGGTIEITKYLGEQERGGVTVCSGVVLTSTIEKSHEGLDTNGNTATVNTDTSAISYEVKWQPYQGTRKSDYYIPQEYEGHAPLTDEEWENYSNILTEGINVEVIDGTHVAQYGTIRAENNIVNSKIPSVEAAIKVGRKAIEYSQLTKEISIDMVPAFDYELFPSAYALMQHQLQGIDERQKIKEIYIGVGPNQNKYTLTFEAS